MNPYHLIHATLGRPAISYSTEQFLQLLGDVNADERDEILSVAYLSYGAEFSETCDKKADKLATYKSFREKFVERSSQLQLAHYEVYAVIGYVLAHAYQKVFGGLQQVIDMHRSLDTGALQGIAEAAEQEIDIESLQAHSKRSIESLHREVEFARRAYANFCELVVKPLVEPELPERSE